MFDWLESTSLAVWVKESWGWPLALTIHAFGSATIVGFSFIMGLRLFGMFHTIPPTSLIGFLPYVWVCVVLQACSGFLLWLTKPLRYLEAGVFDVKLALIIGGIVATAYFQKALKHEAADWASSGAISVRGMKLIVMTAHMMVSPSSADLDRPRSKAGLPLLQASLQTSHPAGIDPSHCPAFGTGRAPRERHHSV